MSAYDDLVQEVGIWRATKGAPVKLKDPNAQALYELNMKWGEVKAAHEAKIEPQRQEYLKERERLLALIPAKPKGPKRAPGRPRRPPFTDGLKLALYRASEELPKGVVRSIMGFTSERDTILLRNTIAEGKDLYELQQASQDRRAAQATEPDESEEW